MRVIRFQVSVDSNGHLGVLYAGLVEVLGFEVSHVMDHLHMEVRRLHFAQGFSLS